MKGVNGVRPSGSQNIFYLQMGVTLAAILATLALAASFMNADAAKTGLHAAIIRVLQNGAVYVFLRPVALHPLLAVGLALGLAYLPSLYGLLGPGFRSPARRYHALCSVPPSAGVAALVIFASLDAARLLDDHGRTYYAAIVALGALAVSVSVGYAWRAVAHRPRTVQDIADNPSVFDLEDLEGIAQPVDLHPKGDSTSLLLPLGDVAWPNLEHSAVASALRGRIVLGRYYDRKTRTPLWVAPEIRNLKDTLVVAPPGSGKTFSIALPWSLELPQMGQSVFAVDVKGNMYNKMKEPFGTARRLYYFDVSAEATDSKSWNPFDELMATGLTSDARLQFAIGRDRLAEAIFGPITAGENRHFDLIDLRTIKTGIELLCYINRHRRAIAILRGIAAGSVGSAGMGKELRAKAKAGLARLDDSPHFVGPATLHTLHDLFLSKDTIRGYFEVVEALQALAKMRKGDKAKACKGGQTKKPCDPYARIGQDAHIFHALQSYLRGLYEEEELKKRSFSERIEGTRNRLEPFGHAAVWRVTDKSNFTLDQIADEPCLFICSAPMNLGLVGSSMAALMVRMIQHVMTGRFKSKGGATDKRLFLILDEFSKLKMGAEQTADFISTSREAGCVSVIFLQDVSQIREEVRQPILANCRDKYFLRGSGPDTAAWCSKALGTRRVPKASLSDSATTATRSRSAGLSASIAEDQAPVLREREIQTTGGLRYGAWMVLDHYSHKPILVDLDRSGGRVERAAKRRPWWNRFS